MGETEQEYGWGSRCGRGVVGNSGRTALRKYGGGEWRAWSGWRGQWFGVCACACVLARVGGGREVLALDQRLSKTSRKPSLTVDGVLHQKMSWSPCHPPSLPFSSNNSLRKVHQALDLAGKITVKRSQIMTTNSKRDSPCP